MNIKSVECVRVNFPEPTHRTSSRPIGQSQTRLSELRRPPWSQDAEVANPMSRYAKYKRHRSLWMPKWDGAWVKVTAEDGTWGLGFTSAGPVVREIVEGHFAQILVGGSVFAIEKCWDLMFRMSKPYGTVGLATLAMSAVDLALWDCVGKLLGKPVVELLGGKVRERTFTYATGNDLDWYKELGFRAFKLACPYGPADGLDGLRLNEQFVSDARDTIGDDCELMLDCYMAFDVEYTVRLAERLRPYRMKWIEEYLVPEDLRGHREVRARLPWQTLATGEHMYTPFPFMQLIEDRSVDILQPDINWCGGLTACRKIAAAAEAAGLQVMLHGGGNQPYGVHFTSATLCSPWVECFVASAPGVPLEETKRFPGQSIPKDSFIAPNDGPGFGLGIEEKWMEPL